MRWQLGILSVVATWGLSYAQAPDPVLVLPRLNNATERLSVKRQAVVENDPVVKYKSPHEAALAALQAGYIAATTEHNSSRALRLFLVAIEPRRDPHFPAALFDIGVLCSQIDRLPDAVSFLEEAQRNAAPDSEVAAAAAAELNRLKAIQRLESTPEGKKRLAYDARLLETVKRQKNDPYAILGEMKELSAIDDLRWETYALAGISHATTGAFADSATDLDHAAGKAEAAHAEAAPRLKSAAEVAHRESGFIEDIRNADQLLEKHQYEAAAKLYTKAWDRSPGHWDVAVEAVTGYLQADQVAPVVPILSRMRNAAPAPWNSRAAAMLKELAAVSDDAKREAQGEAAPVPPQAQLDAAAQIRTLVGSVTRPEMELASQPPHALIDDRTRVYPVADPEIEGGGAELGILSTRSVFQMYQQSLADAAASAPADQNAAEPENRPGGSVPGLPNAATPEPVLPGLARPGRLTERPAVAPPEVTAPPATREAPVVVIETTPPGAAVIVDDSLTCMSPCKPSLPPGRHTASFTMAGYRDEHRIFTVDALHPQPFTPVVLERKRGFLNVESDSPALLIYVDGRATDKRTPARFTLSAGEHEIGIEVEGKMVVKKVDISDNSILVLKF
jgi:tetratricopeptide (TPR) repeat protein